MLLIIAWLAALLFCVHVAAPLDLSAAVPVCRLVL
jgi:hypothetical protein